MPKYQLSSTAELDIGNLYTYGVLEYGLRQANQYFDGLIEQFELLAENPNIGYNSNELAPNLQKFPYGRHILFFTNTDTGILIIRVLGKEMDFKKHL